MATERQTRLAALLAEGRGGVDAMIEAGWPESTARWLGQDAARYLEEAGVPIPAKRTATVAAVPVAPVAAAAETPASAGDDHATKPAGKRAGKEKTL